MTRPRRASVASYPKDRLSLTRGQYDLVESRVLPFLGDGGIRRPLKLVAMEVYLQGLNDALDVSSSTPKTEV